MSVAPEAKVFVADFDDFHENQHQLELLHGLHSKIPGYRVTLFVIPGMCSLKWLQTVKTDWMQFALHGEQHGRECLDWTTEEVHKYLDKYEAWGIFEKVFRAPGWVLNQATFDVLAERKYILAAKQSDDDREVIYPGKLYIHRKNRTEIVPKSDGVQLRIVHGHINNVCGNGLNKKSLERYAKLQGEYRFISELWNT